MCVLFYARSHKSATGRIAQVARAVLHWGPGGSVCWASTLDCVSDQSPVMRVRPARGSALGVAMEPDEIPSVSPPRPYLSAQFLC